MTAKLIKSNLPGFRGTAHLYELSEPIAFDYDWETATYKEKTNYVVVSAANVFGYLETYIFPANKEGEILSWSELHGSFRGARDPERALYKAGYVII